MKNLNTTAGLDVMFTALTELLRVSFVILWIKFCVATLIQETLLMRSAQVLTIKHNYNVLIISNNVY